MRVHWTAPTKIWIFTSLALFYIVIQYHVSSTWPLPTPAAGNEAQENETDPTKILWLRKLVAEEKLAGEVQSALGERITKELAYRVYREVGQHCSRILNETREQDDQTTIYVITPTYRRPEQQAELTRLAQTLMHVRNIYWLLIEDAKEKSTLVSKLLEKWRIRSVHLNVNSAPARLYKGAKPKGVGSRNRGLKWIRENAHDDGVLYFADDDNTYDIELFKEIRSTKKVAMWPVGLVTQTGVSTPIVKNGKFVGFYDGWIGGRKFPVDMAGFAVNIRFLKQRPKAQMAYRVGYEEDSFLKSLAPFEPYEIELKADNCTKLLVWHTQAKKNPPSQPLDKNKYANTNLVQLKNTLV